MIRLLVAAVCLLVGVTSAFGTTFTLKSSVSGQDFDWSSGANYVGEPSTGPAAGDTIVVPNGVTALMSADASVNLLSKINVRVESGAVLKTYYTEPEKGRYQSYVRTLTGSGTVTTPDNQPANVYADLAIAASCVFDGQIEGKLHYRMQNGVRFTLTQDQPKLTGAPLFKDTSELWVGCVGALGRDSGGFNLGTDSTFGYLGAAGLSETLSKASYSGTYFRIDSGEYGGLKLDVTMNEQSNFYQRYAVLKGSNTTESVFGFQVKRVSGPVYMRKEGTGSWRLKVASESKDFRQYDGVTDIQGGVLDYLDELKPIGETSALGTATNLYRYGAANPLVDADRIPHAILLGGDETNPGLLRSCSLITGIQTNYDRLIGLTGCGGFLSGSSRLHYDGITATSAGEKTLVLDGSETHGDTVSNVTNGPGFVSIEKRGTGTWTVRPPCDITGKVTVKAGRLNLGYGPESTIYTWYRLRLKCNAFQDADFAETVKTYYETKGEKPATLTDSNKRRIAVNEFMFFDSEGNRRCIFPMRHYKNGVDVDPATGTVISNSYTIAYQSTNAYVYVCQPGQFSIEDYDRDKGPFGASNRAMGALFEGGALTTDAAYADGIFHYNDWFDQTLGRKLDISDESTWVSIILRPTNSVLPLVACDFIQQDADASQWTGRNLTAFDVSGSTDGLHWDILLDKHLTLLGSSGSGSGASVSTRKLTAANLAKCFPLSKTGPDVPATTLNLTATVSVAPGATLACLGNVVLSKIELSAGGMGVLEGANVSLAEEGSLAIPPFASGVQQQTFHTSLKGISGENNLARWSVTVNGATKNCAVSYDATTGDITVCKKGLFLLVR